MTQRSAEDAEKTVAEAVDRTVKEGATVCEDSLWDAMEQALDGVPTDIIVRTLRKSRANAYRPRGAWREG